MALLFLYQLRESLVIFYPLNKIPLRNPILLFQNSIGSVGGGGQAVPKKKKEKKENWNFLSS